MKKYWILLVLFALALILSGIKPHDYFTWVLEVAPGVVGLAVLLFTFKKFRFTDLTYIMILIHCFILFLGGHYTYAEVPIFNWIQDVFDQSRNNYDKVGHFAQGFIPAFIIRELLIRQNVVSKRGWLAFLTVSVCATVSVFYEFIEWGMALLVGEGADAFLGMQGYIWDTQSDMFFACIGATTMLIVFSRLHDKQIAKMTPKV